ncbi:Smad nuclear-interacting protein 1 [Myotis brandtii]|uniref:Smad nuclear-interacting protein 1 n=1 Tax=Myotis brandtii TaxID=109478 RepID=S7PFI0_MYOBR|nr:PREDICTED: smad nuclear-interacting protein 1 [Myotis brandtii]EPQ09213.1 Smad nuclear-interacting protein 1 [Myotis brandtii]
MKEVKSERERGSRRRHRDEDAVATATVVVKQERLSPEAETSGEPGSPGHRGNRAQRRSRSPAKKKKSSGRRSKSPRSNRSRSPHHSTVKVKQEREDHPPRREREDRQHREASEQEHRRARNSDRGRHRGHSHQRRTSNERPGSGPAQGRDRDRDLQNLPAQEAEREFYNARRREHRQKNEVSTSGNESQELVPPPGGNNKNKEVPVKEKPSFELSGALLEDTNTFRGVVIKYSEPPEARIPKKRWRLYPFKNDEVLPIMYIHRQSAYLLGRHRRIADIPIDHPSCSKQHAVFQYRLVEYTRADGTVGRRVKPHIIDLGSGNGTFLNNKRIEPQRYYELKEKDVLKFGFSSREYVLLHESSDTSEVDRKEDEDEEEEEEVSDS